MKKELLRKLIYFFVAISFCFLGHLTASNTLAENPLPTIGAVNPADPHSLEDNPPIEIYGITCGKADTHQNKCCLNKSLLPLEAITNSDQMDAVVDRINAASSTNKLSQNDIELISSSLKTYLHQQGIDIDKVRFGLYVPAEIKKAVSGLDKLTKGEGASLEEKAFLVKFIKVGNVSNEIQATVNKIFSKSVGGVGDSALEEGDIEIIQSGMEGHPLYKLIQDKMDKLLARFVDPTLSEPLNAFEKAQFSEFVIQGLLHEIDTTKDVGPARLMVRQLFTPNKCIGASFAKVCIRGPMEFLAGLVDKTGLPGGLKDVYTQTERSACEYGNPTTDSTDASCICKNPDGLAAICGRYLSGTAEAGRCTDCINNKGGFWTSLGCIGTDPASFSQSLIGYGLSIGGTFSLLCIFYAAFVLQTSRGNPEKIKKAKENLRACITGLLLIIFSIFIVKVIGVDLLRIPGFN